MISARRISVAIPTFNQAQYLKQAILSAHNQSYKPFEILVYNDCSTDNTANVLENLSKEISELKVVHQNKNKGIVVNKDACLRACSGDYIILLDSDDKLEPNYAETLIKLLSKHSDAGYAHANVQQIDEFDNNTNLRLLYRKKTYHNSDEELKYQLDGMKVAANIIIYRRKALESINYFNCPVNFCEDWYMLCQLADAGYGNVFSKEVLSSYRVWNDKGGVRPKRKLEEIKGYIAVFNEVLLPSFIKRNWSSKLVFNAMTRKAISQTRSLAYDYFTKSEKRELKQTILILSDNYRVRLYIRLYDSKFSLLLLFLDSVKSNTKNLIKRLIIKP